MGFIPFEPLYIPSDDNINYCISDETERPLVLLRNRGECYQNVDCSIAPLDTPYLWSWTVLVKLRGGLP